MVFDRAWFKKHQRGLLLFANTPLGRYALRIHGKRSSVGWHRIVKIEPNAITWCEAGSFKTEFRTHAKFSKRLYYAFKPLWYMLHGWDLVFGRVYNFGFDTLTEYPDADPETDTFDATMAAENFNVSFDTLHDQSQFNTADDAGDIDEFAALYSSISNDMFDILSRSIFLFDTSSIPDTNEISDVTLSLFGFIAVNQIGSPDLHICSSAPTFNDEASPDDYSSLGDVSFGSVSHAGFNDSGYNNIALNASGIANVSKNGNSDFGARLSWDINDSFTGSWTDEGTSGFVGFFADNSGTSQDPKLVVTHTAPITSDIKELTGVPQASVKKAAGILVASVKKVVGVLNV